MKELDCVEVIVEKKRYADEGVHKGMQGWICDGDCIDGYWLVNFPQYGEKDDIAEIQLPFIISPYQFLAYMYTGR